MTGEKAFLEDPTRFGRNDRMIYGAWEHLPEGLRAYYRIRAAKIASGEKLEQRLENGLNRSDTIWPGK